MKEVMLTELGKNEELYLCFIRLIGEENDGYYRYEFIFTNDVDNVFGEE